MAAMGSTTIQVSRAGLINAIIFSSVLSIALPASNRNLSHGELLSLIRILPAPLLLTLKSPALKGTVLLSLQSLSGQRLFSSQLSCSHTLLHLEQTTILSPAARGQPVKPSTLPCFKNLLSLRSDNTYTFFVILHNYLSA